MSLRARYRNVAVALLLAGLVCTVAVTAAQSATKSSTATSGLTVHEWGTFTSIAGPDGSAIQWRPLSGPSDLPCFVRGLPGGIKYPYPVDGTQLTTSAAASAVLGAMAATVRMETPVLYFYSSQETRVDVSVQFPYGLITEWYPNAAVQPTFAPANVASSFGAITWSGVRVLPGARADYPTEPGSSHYYAARGTDAAPVQVNGQTEKFLFYRGLGGFQVPVSAIVDRGKFVVESPSVTLNHVVLFENRGGRVGYRVVKGLKGRTVIDAPELTAKVEFLHWDLERMLIAEGLYPREAKAMVETWRDSWFEEGARVFYLLPKSAVDAILPLQITPAPEQVSRAFVGRLEILTPEVLAEAEAAFAKNDLPTLNKFGRFLEPIAWRLLGKAQPSLDPARVTAQLRLIAASHVNEAPCR